MSNNRHGRIVFPKSRGFIATQNKWWGIDWETLELEGGKNFPSTKAGPCIREPSDVPSSIPPLDGMILSGGKTDKRIFLNLTDNELKKEGKGEWPKHKPEKIQNFIWEYSAIHKTRGYVAYITKDTWDRNKTVTRDSFEQNPIYENISKDIPYWEHELPVTNALSIPLPVDSKHGHHIVLIMWIIADTSMAFYQTIDFDFD